MLPPLHLGEVLRDRYKITAYVGQGGMGSIYQADDLRLEGRLCAIKEVQNDVSLAPEAQQQVMGAHLKHFGEHGAAQVLAQCIDEGFQDKDIHDPAHL